MPIEVRASYQEEDNLGIGKSNIIRPQDGLKAFGFQDDSSELVVYRCLPQDDGAEAWRMGRQEAIDLVYNDRSRYNVLPEDFNQNPDMVLPYGAEGKLFLPQAANFVIYLHFKHFKEKSELDKQYLLAEPIDLNSYRQS